jgi:hypothetical protein
MDISKKIDELILKEREEMLNSALLYVETNKPESRDTYMKHKYTFTILKEFLENNKINFDNISKDLLSFKLLKQKLLEKSIEKPEEKSIENIEEKSIEKPEEKSVNQKSSNTKTPRTRKKKEEN